MRRIGRIDPDADLYVQKALAALWTQVCARVPDLAGSRATWDGWSVSVRPAAKAKIPPDRADALEEAAEDALRALGLGEVSVYLEIAGGKK